MTRPAPTWRPGRRLARSALVIAALAAGLPGCHPTAGAVRPAPAQSDRPSALRVDRDELMRVVRALSAPSMAGRRTGSPGGLAARAFIRDAFAKIGLTPPATGWLQPFSFSDDQGTVRGGGAAPVAVTGANVIGSVAGRQANARAIVVSAHYDHEGEHDGVVYPGADDNASGVAALLAVARHVQAHPLQHRVIFAAFDAEERGLAGARAFVRTPPVPLASIALNVNFDMVSRSDRHEIVAAGTAHSPWLMPIVAAVQRRSPVTIRFGHDRPASRPGDPDDWTMQSDHGVFHAAGVPFLYFGVEDHPDYHQPGDTADKIDPAFFGDVVHMLVDVVVTADRALR